MMKRLVFDIETNGLLRELDRVHSLVIQDYETGELWSCDDHTTGTPSIRDGLAILEEGDELIGHNIVNFDIPALKKIYPGFSPKGTLKDTFITTQVLWGDIINSDLGRREKGTLPGRLIGSHSLEAWGYRLGKWKGDYSENKKQELRAAAKARGEALTKDELNALVWANWSKDMQDYCVQDVAVTLEIYRACRKKVGKDRSALPAIDLEHDVSSLCAQIERNGFPFHTDRAVALYAKLAAKRQVVEQELKDTFGSWFEVVELVDPARTVRYKDPERIDRIKGEPWTKVKEVHFNPASRHHIAKRLKALHDWHPTEFTKGGDPKVDEEVLASLPYPEAELLSEYFLLNKRIGQIAEGDQAWLKNDAGGVVYHSINTNATVTSRASHSNFNIAQVPGSAAPYGEECRKCFGLHDGFIKHVKDKYGTDWSKGTQIGTDKSGLELRCLGHYMARWDDGAYIDVLLSGDPHWLTVEGLGLVAEGTERYAGWDAEGAPIVVPIHELFRSGAKTFI